MPFSRLDSSIGSFVIGMGRLTLDSGVPMLWSFCASVALGEYFISYALQIIRRGTHALLGFAGTALSLVVSVVLTGTDGSGFAFDVVL